MKYNFDKLIQEVLFNETELDLKDAFESVLSKLNTKDKLYFLRNLNSYIIEQSPHTIKILIREYFHSVLTQTPKKNIWSITGMSYTANELNEYNEIILSGREHELNSLLKELPLKIKREENNLEYEDTFYNKKRKPLTSFKIIDSQFDSNKLHESLIHENYIHNDTQLENFNKIFNDTIISEIEPIIWLSNPAQLLFIFKHLIFTKKINNRPLKFKVLGCIFENSSSQQFDIKSWKVIYAQASDSGNQLSSDNFDKLTALLKKTYK